MIIMLNGSFGVGKTSVAGELARIFPNSMIYDPELVGSALKRMTEGIRAAQEETDDFQDLTLWPTLTVVTARYLFRQYGRSLIVPMTIANPIYFDTIRRGLAAISQPLYHFCLVAPLHVIEQRLQSREDDTSWAWKKAQEYVPLFGERRYSVHINSEGTTIASIASQIEHYILDNPKGSR